jgi:hypothetical protein
MDESMMEINMSKCAAASYISDENRRRTYLDDTFQFRKEGIPNFMTPESMRYLSALIAARRTIKLRSAKLSLKAMEILLGKIISAWRSTVQQSDAVKTFLLPSTDFFLLNGGIGRSQLRVMDNKIREIITKELTIKGLPIECHYVSERDGGLSSPSLRGRGGVLTIRSFVQTMLSDDMRVCAAMRQFIEDEREFRRTEIDPNA